MSVLYRRTRPKTRDGYNRLVERMSTGAAERNAKAIEKRARRAARNRRVAVAAEQREEQRAQWRYMDSIAVIDTTTGDPRA